MSNVFQNLNGTGIDYASHGQIRSCDCAENPLILVNSLDVPHFYHFDSFRTHGDGCDFIANHKAKTSHIRHALYWVNQSTSNK